MKCRKLLAILLALVMVIGLLPFAALADGSQDSQLDYIQGTDPDPVGDPGIDPGVDPDIQPDTDLNIDPDGEPDGNLLGDPDQDLAPGVMLLNDTHEGEEDWTALTNTTESWKLGNGKYYLDENLELGISQQIIIQGDVTLCLNGRTLKSAAAYNTGAIKVETGATLTICDCGTGGTITCSYTSQKPVIFIKGTCNLKKGTISLTNPTSPTLGYAILVDTRASFTMSGGTLIGGKTGIYNRGTARISGGSITGMESGIETATNPAVFHISGGTFTGDGADSSGILITNGSLNMTGGTAIGTKAGVNLRTTSINNPEDISLAISGGTMQGQYGIYHQSDYPLYLTGAPKLSTLYLASTENEVFVSKNGEAYSGERIEISLGSGASEDAIVIKGVKGNANNFTYAGEDFELAADDEGNLILQTPTTAPEHANHGADGTNTDPQTWQPWTQATDLSSITSGYYYLTANITHDDMVMIAKNAEVHICLNGHTMSQSVLYVGNNASVTICDCKEDGEIIGGSIGALMLNGGSTVDFYSGTISSEATDAVNITLTTAEAQATFNMYGGTINSKKMGISNNGGIVNVYGGTILFDDYAGVFNGNNRSVATIAGGTIQPQEDAARGDNGVYVSKGTLYLTGDAEISGLNGDIKINNPNAVYASNGDAAYSGESLSIYFSGGATVTEPIILDVTNDNADLFELVWPYKKDLVRDSNNNLVLGTKPVGHQNHGADGTGEIPAGKEWIAWNGTTQMDTAGYYYLDHDITLESSITIRENINLCLNGCTITYSGNGQVFTVDGGSLTICDCSPGQTGTIQYNKSSSYYQAIKVNNYGTLNLYGGTVDGSGSRGIFCNGGKVNVYGGTITVTGNNSAIDTKGGTVTLSGGTVSGNIRLWTRVTLNLGTSTITGSVVMRNSAMCKGYENTINAQANSEAYKGAAITIKPDSADGTIPAGTVIVHNATEEQASLFSLEGYTLTYKNGTLVVGGDEIELNVTMSESIKYGDTCQVSVSGAPEGATVSYQIEGNTPRERAEISSEGLITPYTTGTFTVTVTADCEGYAQKTVQKTLTVLPKAITITAKDQRLEHGEEIAEGVQQVTVATLVTGDTLYSIDLTASDTAITPDNAVIKQGDADVTAYYDISYESGELTFYNVPQEDFAIIDQPAAVTYGDTFTLDTTGGSGTGTVTWRATGAADVDDEGNVTIIGAGTFIITATKAGNATYQAAEAEVTGTAAPKAITITANDQRLEHGETIEEGVQQVTVAALVAGDTLDSIVLTADDTDIEPSNAIIKQGDADVTAYYDISYESGELTFYNVPQTGFAIIDQPDTVTYGDTFTLDTTGGSGTGTVTWRATGAATVDQEGNVTITGVGDFTIKATKAGDDTYAEAVAAYEGVAAQKAVTIAADDKAVALDAPAPAYTLTVTGALPADLEAIEGAYTLACDYAPGDPAGTYAITVRGSFPAALAGNYAVTVENGVLTVSANLAAVAKEPKAAAGLVYTGKAQQLITAGEAENGVMVYSLDGTRYAAALPAATDAGTYTVYYKVLGDAGYADTAPAHFQVVIAKAKLTVKANDIWVYAGNTPKFTATIKGYVNGEDWRVLKGELTFTCGYSQKYSKPGSRYTITPKGLTADNYDITFKTGTLTVKDPLSPRFNVYVLDSKHGTVEADCRYARKGDVVTLTIKPDWGYELETLTVTDSHGYELKLTYHSNGTYTFTMPRDNVTVKAIFTVRDMPFVDVPGDAWYAGGVRYVYAHGLMNGTGSWRFSPNRTTTRAMIATILYRMEGSPRVYGTSQFGDVEAGSWYEDAVIWATQNDIVEGYTSKTFGPNDPITREQMAAMLYRYADYCRCDMSAGRYVDLSKFSDMDKISDYAIPALRWAVGEEIIQGRTGKRLAPTDTATRAEVAVMLMRFCEDVIW